MSRHLRRWFPPPPGGALDSQPNGGAACGADGGGVCWLSATERAKSGTKTFLGQPPQRAAETHDDGVPGPGQLRTQLRNSSNNDNKVTWDSSSVRGSGAAQICGCDRAGDDGVPCVVDGGRWVARGPVLLRWRKVPLFGASEGTGRDGASLVRSGITGRRRRRSRSKSKRPNVTTWAKTHRKVVLNAEEGRRQAVDA
ncbi:hypothetical protein CSOJ01_00822 [Colletotrichum sojae]|uniref:Uncharacterized protein n=1 Tax=Colletotrichum sojae TaxID=2175907 RepID=A0A8H6JXF2_9PEZI|nr:hypothetical protein CSOJ01_00822 [Colletotrichum sojae]